MPLNSLTSRLSRDWDSSAAIPAHHLGFLMTIHILLPLALFVFVNSITPGPNNVMLTAAGANFGYRRCLPHMLGITSGVALMVMLVGMGLGTVFDTLPGAYTTLKYLGGAYLIYLAWRIARSRSSSGVRAHGKPFSFWEAAFFQWVNPKAWIMVIGMIAAYMPQSYVGHDLVLAAAVLAAVNYPSISVWTLFGSAVGRLLHGPRAMQIFNNSMAVLLVLSLYPLVFA